MTFYEVTQKISRFKYKKTIIAMVMFFLTIYILATHVKLLALILAAVLAALILWLVFSFFSEVVFNERKM